MMLNHYGKKTNSNSTSKLTLPILIPVSEKIIKETIDTYDTYDNSVPKYGSVDNSPPSALLNKRVPLYKKCSESSNIPNNPFGTSPPDKRYMTSVYLNMVANNNLRRSFVEG